MQIQIVYDNQAMPGFRAGWGFSCLVDGHILFDTGEDAVSLFANLERLGVSRSAISAVVISHDHWDHTGGLWALLEERPGLTVYACPGFGAGFKGRVAALGGQMVETSPNLRVTEGIHVTGEIPAVYKGESMPEQSLVVKTARGLVVVTGCSHPGIVQVLQAVRDRVDLVAPLSLVLGGFHLLRETPLTIREVQNAFEALGVSRVGPTHCSGAAAQALFQKQYGDRFLALGAGAVLTV